MGEATFGFDCVSLALELVAHGLLGERAADASPASPIAAARERALGDCTQRAFVHIQFTQLGLPERIESE